MIKHIYLFKIKKEINPDEVIQKLYTLKDHIPEIKEIEIARDFRKAENSYDICENLTFSNMENFKSFVNNSYHNNIRQYMSTVQTASVKIDYII